jgi:cell division initiation protein
MRLRPADIQAQTFRTTFRGFDPVEVDSFLNRLSDELERLLEERNNLEGELEHERSARRQLEEAMAAARHLQESIIEKAKEDARVTMNQAKLLSDRLILEAREEVSAIRQDARKLREHRSNVLADLSAMAHRLNDWIARMDREGEAEVVVPEEEAPPGSLPYAREVLMATEPDKDPDIDPDADPVWVQEGFIEAPAETEAAYDAAPETGATAYGSETRTSFRLASGPEPRLETFEIGKTSHRDDAAMDVLDESALLEEHK